MNIAQFTHSYVTFYFQMCYINTLMNILEHLSGKCVEILQDVCILVELLVHRIRTLNFSK